MTLQPLPISIHLRAAHVEREFQPENRHDKVPLTCLGLEDVEFMDNLRLCAEFVGPRPICVVDPPNTEWPVGFCATSGLVSDQVKFWLGCQVLQSFWMIHKLGSHCLQSDFRQKTG